MEELNTNEQQIEETVAAAEGGDVEAGELSSSTSSEDASPQATESEQSSEPDSETADDSAEESNEEAAVDGSVVDQWAAALGAADPERFAKMTELFNADEPFSDEDIAWVTEVNKSPSTDATRYVLELQRSEFKAQQKPDTSIADAEAVVGNLDVLIDFAKANAPKERVAEWQTIVDFAHRTGDDAMMLGALKEMKAFKDSIPGNRPKTLGHLAASQPNTKVEEPAAPAPETKAPEADPKFAGMVNFSSQALANICLNNAADPAAKAAASAELKRRGI